jgi:hypothetical protein
MNFPRPMVIADGLADLRGSRLLKSRQEGCLLI